MMIDRAAHHPSTEVLDGFREIAACTGNKSQEKKIAVIRKLLLNCAKDGSEVKFIVRGACVGGAVASSLPFCFVPL